MRGCSRTHLAVTLGDWSDPLDPDAEAQVLYRHLLSVKDMLRFVHGIFHIFHTLLFVCICFFSFHCYVVVFTIYGCLSNHLT